MPTYVSRTRTAASPDDVWPLVADLTRHGEWSADPLEVTATGDGTYESVARSKGKELRARLTVLESDAAARRLGFRATDATGTYEHVITLAPDGAGTAVTRQITATSLTPAQRVLFYLVLYVVKKPNARKALTRLGERAAPS
jgi:hypothetical protein